MKTSTNTHPTQRRPAATPAYYLTRPATCWLEAVKPKRPKGPVR